MRSAVQLVNGRTWGELHFLRIDHALGELPVIARLLRLNMKQVSAGGSETTVNVLHPDGRSIPMIAAYGASQRHVVDLADLDGSGGFIIPTGQAGLPYDPHYRDQFGPWRRGGLWLLPLDLQVLAARTVHRLQLEPN
jgi:penicillin amidase